MMGDADVIRNALADLPKTLDETYERIFLAIPREDWPFVRHVLTWIHFHSNLYSENIPSATLLQAAGQTDAGLNTSSPEYFYDEESVKEICGCLVNVERPNASSPSFVSFAHYTVR